jgi:hypothetical protein
MMANPELDGAVDQPFGSPVNYSSSPREKVAMNDFTQDE